MSTLYVDNLQPNLGSRVMAAGHVVQVVEGSNSTAKTISSTTYTDTNLSVTITPSSASSKVLVFVQQYLTVNNTGTTEIGAGLKLLRGTTVVADLDDARRAAMQSQTTGGNQQLGGSVFLQHLDSPSTTSPVTYKTQAAVYTTSGSGSTTAQKNSTESRIVVMEIAQ
jgi:hypothetical protein